MSGAIQKVFLALDEAALAVKQVKPEESAAGEIVKVSDGVAEVAGLRGVFLGEALTVSGAEARALVMQVEGETARVVVLEKTGEVKAGQKVTRSGKRLEIGVGEEALGRVMTPLGEAVDGGGKIETKERRLIEEKAPGVVDRQPVHEPLKTGVLAVDALIPIGRGQRELIIGDRQTGKTTLAVDAILNQKQTGVKCVYVAIGQRESKIAQVVATLQKHGAMKHTCVVAASASSSAAMQYLAPYAGMAVAEHFMHKGEAALIVFDDLSKHAVAYRELSLLLRKPPGREAYPGDVFYIHSRLLERAAKLSGEKGGGSVTALPIIETQAGDVSAYIPTNVISITDGQIFLETQLFYKGIRPAINVGISVSRVGGAAQTHLLKKVAGSTKLQLAQYFELAAFAQFASELDEQAKKQLVRGERVVEILKQKPEQPYPEWKQAALLFAANSGFLDKCEKGKTLETAVAAVEVLAAREKELVAHMEKEAKWDEWVEKGLSGFFSEYFKTAYGSN